MINKQHVGNYFFNTWSMYHCLSQHRSHGPIFPFLKLSLKFVKLFLLPVFVNVLKSTSKIEIFTPKIDKINKPKTENLNWTHNVCLQQCLEVYTKGLTKHQKNI